MVRARRRGNGTSGNLKRAPLRAFLFFFLIWQTPANTIRPQMHGEQHTHEAYLQPDQAAFWRHFPVSFPAFLSLSRNRGPDIATKMQQQVKVAAAELVDVAGV